MPPRVCAAVKQRSGDGGVELPAPRGTTAGEVGPQSSCEGVENGVGDGCDGGLQVRLRAAAAAAAAAAAKSEARVLKTLSSSLPLERREHERLYSGRETQRQKHMEIERDGAMKTEKGRGSETELASEQAIQRN